MTEKANYGMHIHPLPAEYGLRSRADWLQDAGVRAVVDAMQSEGLALRFVGGCVRDSLLGRSKAQPDIDAATPATPDQVMDCVNRAGLRAIPTGLAHGTVTVLTGRESIPRVEVTTLRIDAECDGRHAQVRYTDDWQADVRRRDFTINALMLEPDGTLHDYTGGLADLAEGRVRFIGEAAQRITEDRLRVLRLFRFQAHLGRVPPEADALAACGAAAGELHHLSVERIWAEVKKLLSAPVASEALSLMEACGVLGALLQGRAADLAALRRLELCEVQTESAPDPILRLVALLVGQAQVQIQHWKASGAEVRYAAALHDAAMWLEQQSTEVPTRETLLHCLYRYGHAVSAAALLLVAARRDWALHAPMLQALRAQPVPVFPVTGAMLRERGMEEGAALGARLKALEACWIASGFALDAEALLQSK